ncbi:ABC-type phosphate transport system, periplasmic component [Rivularia sp. PCC 7116]|uniref:substrate-binding domain-containing protein n=1 Tax=Rivularia sp. PCC 7116 TaxID=373994 RepID=UPI00029EF6DB|nr:substrate-binding domain-containing protein [Rivularia sp. PCC 7116]AFY56153.1 ABC-type phosphate transport system, periplasmic component [Rivularia sp. PCC 7116]
MAIVKLKIRESKEGFQVDLTARELYIEAEGYLPPLPPKLETSFNNWQLAYREIDAVRSVFTSTQVRLTPKNITKYSSAEYTTSVKDSLNQWLNCGDSKWLPVRDRLIAIAQQLHHKNEEIRVIIDAKDVKLRRLPWQEWNLFEEHYPQVEIALSAAKNTLKQTKYTIPQSSKIRVLVAVGRSDGINTQEDLEVIKDLEQHGAEVVCLMQPNRKELCEALWDEQGYHIFIFTGHSGSQENGHIGWIELNDTDRLSIEEFKEALKQAINKGLQLAIFNSCDGLGLASQLAHLHLSRCIVMREPVPDRVAVEFLKYFFKEFTRNQSLSTALNKARKQLEHFNLDYPGAVWLPTICIAPNVRSLTWKSLNPENVAPVEVSHKLEKPLPKDKPNIKVLIFICLFVSSIAGILAWNWFSKPQPIQPIAKIPTEKPFAQFASVNVPSAKFNYGGSTTWAPITKLLNKKINRVHPQFQLEYKRRQQEEPGSGTGIQMLLNKELDFSLSSRNLTTSELEDAKKLGINLQKIPIAVDAIAVAINHSINIDELTLKELEKIYTGRIRNWQELGGPNLAIKPYSRSKEVGGTVEFFYRNVLRGEKFSNSLEIVRDTTQGIRKVSQNPAGIYYGSASEIVNQCRVKTVKLGNTKDNMVAPYKQPLILPPDCEQKPNQVDIDKLSSNDEYPITRRLYVIYKHSSINPDPDLTEDFKIVKAAKAVEAYTKLLKTDEGKQLIKEAGFLPVN